jgi:hypothetical protein
MPIMVGPGAIATILGMISLIRHAEFEILAFIGISAEILATMLVTYMVVVVKIVLERIGPRVSRLPRVSLAFLLPLWAWG